MSEQHLSVGEALPLEIARVRDKVLPYYLECQGGEFAATIMRSHMDTAARAMAEGDVIGMITALQDLRGWDV